MRLLVIEDDKQIASFLTNGLRQEGFAVDHVENGEDGLHFALTEPYDVMIIDIMLPGIDGLTIVEKLRAAGKGTPVLILSAKRSVDDRVRGIQKGGDDYMIKPFAFSELLARIHALLRRSTGFSETNALELGDLKIDLLKRDATRAGKTLELQPKEFSLLEYLARNTNRVVSKTMIMEHIWDFHFDPQMNVVDVLVCRLRSKVDKNFSKKMIQTVRGVGYVLKIPD